MLSIISTPVTYEAGLAALAQKGILIKGGAHLESLGLVKKIAFDKTGPLTQGQFALLHLEVVSSRRSRKEVLELLSLMEERASHPVGSHDSHEHNGSKPHIPRRRRSDKHCQRFRTVCWKQAPFPKAWIIRGSSRGSKRDFVRLGLPQEKVLGFESRR